MFVDGRSGIAETTGTSGLAGVLADALASTMSGSWTGVDIGCFHDFMLEGPWDISCLEDACSSHLLDLKIEIGM